MLLAHPAVLRDLVEEYDALAALHGGTGANSANGANDSDGTRRRLDDVAYTLCVSTGTRDVATALATARPRLPGADQTASGGAARRA
jgi:Protein of unknown function (DUF5133)